MEPYNPYSPPASREDKPFVRPTHGVARGMWIKWAFLIVCALTFILSLGIIQIAPLIGAPSAIFLVGGCFIGWATFTCMWIYRAWSDIPPQMPGAISPSEAVWKLFVPFYNLYWMFFIGAALCDVLNRRLARLRLEPMAPRALSTIGCSIHLAGLFGRIPGFVGAAPFVAIIGHAVWFNYMVECDKARAILAKHSEAESEDDDSTD